LRLTILMASCGMRLLHTIKLFMLVIMFIWGKLLRTFIYSSSPLPPTLHQQASKFSGDLAVPHSSISSSSYSPGCISLLHVDVNRLLKFPWA